MRSLIETYRDTLRRFPKTMALLARGIDARERADPAEGLDPKGESPTGEAGDAQKGPDLG